MLPVDILYNKRKFLLMVFANLIIQLGITYYIMERTNASLYNKIGFWWLFILQMSIVYVITTFNMNPAFKFILFSILSGLFGVNLSHLKTIYDKEAIKVAMQSALGIFGAMFAVGISLILFGIKLGPTVGVIMLFSLIAIIIARLIYIVTNTTSKIFSTLILILFSLYVIYDTNIMLQRNYNGDFITASLDYYVDVLNLFIGSLDD